MLFLYGLFVLVFVLLFGLLVGYIALMLLACWDAFAQARASRLVLIGDEDGRDGAAWLV